MEKRSSITDQTRVYTGYLEGDTGHWEWVFGDRSRENLSYTHPLKAIHFYTKNKLKGCRKPWEKAEPWAPLGPAEKGRLPRGQEPPTYCPVGASEDMLHTGVGTHRGYSSQHIHSRRPLPELRGGRREGPQPLPPLFLCWQNLQTSGLKQMTSLWFPVLTTLQVHRLLGWGGTLVPGVFPAACRSLPSPSSFWSRARASFFGSVNANTHK